MGSVGGRAASRFRMSTKDSLDALAYKAAQRQQNVPQQHR